MDTRICHGESHHGPAARAFAGVADDLSDSAVRLTRIKPKSDALPARVLALLASSPTPLSATRVADRLRVSRPTAESVLKAMAGAGQIAEGQTPGGQHRYGAPARPAAPRGLICKALGIGASGSAEPDLAAMLAALGRPDE